MQAETFCTLLLFTSALAAVIKKDDGRSENKILKEDASTKTEVPNPVPLFVFEPVGALVEDDAENDVTDAARRKRAALVERGDVMKHGLYHDKVLSRRRRSPRSGHYKHFLSLSELRGRKTFNWG